jgi:hypothetical protein
MNCGYFNIKPSLRCKQETSIDLKVNDLIKLRSTERENERLINDNANLYNKIGSERQLFKHKISTLVAQLEIEKAKMQRYSSRNINTLVNLSNDNETQLIVIKDDDGFPEGEFKM